jgi:hypothetical protein
MPWKLADIHSLCRSLEQEHPGFHGNARQTWCPQSGLQRPHLQRKFYRIISLSIPQALPEVEEHLSAKVYILIGSMSLVVHMMEYSLPAVLTPAVYFCESGEQLQTIYYH